MAFNEQEKQILQWSIENGKSKEETKQAIFRFRTTGSPKDPNAQVAQEVEEQPSFGQEIATSANTRADRFGEILGREDTSAGRKGVQLFGQGAGLASGVIEAGVSRVPGVKQVFEGLGKGINFLATSENSPIKKLGDVIGESEALQGATTLYDTDQDFKDTVDAVANIAILSGDVTGAMQSKAFIKNVTKKLEGLIDGLKAGTSISTKIDDSITGASNLRTKIQTTLAGKNVNPQLEVSARRFAQGTDRLQDPLTTYESFLTQSKEAVVDIKKDPAISVVGEKIGDSFGSVVKMRRGVGEVMGSELKKIGGVKTNITGLADDFVDELGNVERFATSEQKVLEEYLNGLLKLGDNPTISQIDDFLVRTNAELQLFKGKQGLTTTTNAERIIKGNLSKLRKQFDPEVTGNTQLQAYSDARTQYSELTNFITEGERHLGKLTQSGDFAKDASLAKSSVQSVLNNGKKDWLLELEGLTGYQATDEAVLALQAMKDAGDFRGLSLLETFADSPAITPTGVVDKIVNFGIEKGKKAIIGSPEEQTRAFLKSLGNNSPSPSNSILDRGRKFLQSVRDEAKNNGQRGFVKNPLKKAQFKNIPPDDLGEVLDFIDGARGIRELSPDTSISGRRILERYGGNPNQSDIKVANDLAKLIEGNPGVLK